MRRFIWISLMLVGVSGLDFIARKDLPYAYSEIVSYNKLYYPEEVLRISGLHVAPGDSLVMEVKGRGIKSSNLFELYAGNRLLVRQQAPVLTMRPPVEQKQFFLRINSSPDSVEVNIDYTPVNVYRQSGNSGDVLYEVTSRALPVTSEALRPVGDWQTPWPAGDEAQRAAVLLRDSMQVNKSDRPATIVYKIAAYILRATRGKLGVPSDSLSGLNPVN